MRKLIRFSTIRTMFSFDSSSTPNFSSTFNQSNKCCRDKKKKNKHVISNLIKHICHVARNILCVAM